MTELATSTRGDRVAYDRYGPADGGPTAVLVAGAGSLRGDDGIATTARVAADAGVTVLVPDRLGRGESAAEGRLDLDREVEGLRAVLAAEGGHGVLCGHSSGCSISLYAAAQGLAVDGLLLWEAPVAAPASQTAGWVDELERRIDAGELEAAQEWYMKDMPPEWLAGAKASPAWPVIYAGVVSLRADGQSLRWATAGLESGALREQVDVPVLATYGTSTFPAMVEAAERIRTVLPQTEVREVSGAHHVWDATAFASVLTGFVRSCGPTRR
ncbi:alpha/beta fold hydrolase [Microlunatus antarcticus]|uniref:Pimeloyl-ACP methyl ester carboxylesterase n=1 Tax=Microlunatus antarcticus TaxID=53388 RepID=A0A7W5JZE3_9ACTN|nr:alpha/beta hydrolase [Microlunatus antarcticus]MBB3329058.1 pimeloyl-ACP methyl ester carboxylesterase [Microlunatus antarcticus]